MIRISDLEVILNGIGLDCHQDRSWHASLLEILGVLAQTNITQPTIQADIKKQNKEREKGHTK